LDGTFEELTDGVSSPLGIALKRPDWHPAQRTLSGGQRLILYSDGVSERRTAAGELLGLEGIRAAVAGASGVSAVATTRAVAGAVRLASTAPLRDDATMMVLRVAGSMEH
jgi:serine phosphatase RsbU (regulator of sigma subunit)